MKVLSLNQPWASLMLTQHPDRATPVKDWETRSWKPSQENMDIIRRDGMLIHASLGKSYGRGEARVSCRELCYQLPFSKYIKDGPGFDKLPFGFIIGKVIVGRIIRTEQWLHQAKTDKTQKQRWNDQRDLGDYSPNRFAWEILSFQKFKSIIPVKGALSLWDFPMCKICGCWEEDACFHPDHGNCRWASKDICSHCVNVPGKAIRYSKLQTQ